MVGLDEGVCEVACRDRRGHRRTTALAHPRQVADTFSRRSAAVVKAAGGAPDLVVHDLVDKSMFVGDAA